MGEYNQAVRLWREEEEEEESDSEGEGDLATDMEHQIHLIKRAHRKMRVYMCYLNVRTHAVYNQHLINNQCSRTGSRGRSQEGRSPPAQVVATLLLLWQSTE